MVMGVADSPSSVSMTGAADATIAVRARKSVESSMVDGVVCLGK